MVWRPLAVMVFLYVDLFFLSSADGNADARFLVEHLLVGYNRLVRPVRNSSDILSVLLKLKLAQLLDVHEKNQIMTTNVWLRQQWQDVNFEWLPSDYGGVKMLYLPSEEIWLPDIVLYNNADGNYQVTIMTKAMVFYNGTVIWEPPAVYNSICQMEVRWFPFDEQNCEMTFGSWTYDGGEVDVIHLDTQSGSVLLLDVEQQQQQQNYTLVERGVDLSDFYPSAEWDLMATPSRRHQLYYKCCEAPRIDITFYLEIRRKTLFYTVNLIIPSVGISFLTILVFYLPSDSGEKVVLCISILISLTLFFLLLVEIIPSTSLMIPLIGLYLLFTMVMVTLSIIATVIALNVHYRSATTHRMPNILAAVFLKWLPRLLRISQPMRRHGPLDLDLLFDAVERSASGRWRQSLADTSHLPFLPAPASDKLRLAPPDFGADLLLRQRQRSLPTTAAGRTTSDEHPTAEQLRKSLRTASASGVFIADHFRQIVADDEVREDWRFIASVLDRLFLIAFSLTTLIGTCVILFQAPRFRDTRQPLVPAYAH